MRYLNVLLLVLLVLAIPAYAVCNVGIASHAIPAVVGQDGGLFPVDVRTIPGSGNIFLTTSPHTGVSTQISADDAVRYGFIIANMSLSDCDVLVNIHANNIADYVDGPSAGLAFSTLTYSVLTGIPIRSDATLTGGVGPNGVVTRVGGLYEKARASARYGIKYFVTPVNTLQEKVLLKRLERTYNISIIEIADIKGAIDFLFYNKLPPYISINKQELIYPNVTNYSISLVYAPFKNVTSAMVATESSAIETIAVTDGDSAEIKQQFQDGIKKQNYLISKGYLFTAANEAFMGYIGAGTVVASDSSSSTVIDDKKNEIRTCINSLPMITKTSNNFDYALGADLRKFWAINRLESIDFNSSDLAEERFYKYNQLLYADAWCKVSKALGEEALARNTGIVYNESLLQSLAMKKLQQAQLLPNDNPDYKEKLQTAKSLEISGKHAASIYDSTYLISMQNSDSELSNLSQLQLVAKVHDLENQSFNSLWGQVYQSHAAFLAQDINEGGLGSAYHVFSYAATLDNTTNEMVTILNSDQFDAIILPQPDENDSENSNDFSVIYAVILILAVVVLIIFTLKFKPTIKSINYRKNTKNKKFS
ncbi:MAG: S16 family serine protease [Candidatus Micrarchaeota archaeon]|nr:S16 family serine protease [Candidatus Micrarchaeota archaeon]